MCGIAGIQFKHPVEAAVLAQAAAHFQRSLHHRGPDHFGLHQDTRRVLCNLRLAIVDRAGGQQPIYAPAPAGGRRGIVYNGEVYNHEALRQPLAALHRFHTTSDTEVLLASWSAHGEAAFAQWNGMFAACLFDDTALTLVRDRFGMKPLYVYEDEHVLAFASELRTLLGLPGLDHALDPVGFQDYLAYRYTLAPHTLFARIRKLPAGHWLRVAADGSCTEGRFAEPAMHDGEAARPEGELLEELDGLLTGAVRSQLMGEVPIGVLLSGGLDSSAIAASVARAGARLRAYSIGFPEVNEFAYSRAVAERYGLDYTEVCLTQDELRAGMDRVLNEIDEPIADPACFALSRLCQEIRKDVTVVLSGEGGDEMFGGYAQHELALDASIPAHERFARFFMASASDPQANALLRDKSLPLAHLRWRGVFDRCPTPLAAMQGFELQTWMPENLMMKADKVLMAHSLEGRFPFLDLDLYRFASRLPAALKLPQPGAGKYLLRKLMQPLLPESVITRRKMGFTVPTPFFLQPLRERLLGALESLERGPVGSVLDIPAARALFEGYYAGQAVSPLKAWNLAVLVLWWAEVYPALRPARSAAASPEHGPGRAPGPAATAAGGPRPRLTVYTVLVGAKEALNDPWEELPAGSTTDLEIDWVCLSDQPGLQSKVWRVEPFTERHLPAEKLSRRAKAMPHLYFADSEFSLYVDNTVNFKRLPCAADLVHEGEYLFRAFRHATRNTPQEEAAAVATIGYDEVGTVCAQMEFYARQRRLDEITPLTTATVLLRSHHHPVLQRFGTLWWESILAFSKRDQLSFDYARLEAGARIAYWPGSSDRNDLVRWHGGLGRRRVQANFDAARYAWLHREDPAALADPRSHFLAHAQAGDTNWRRPVALLEYAAHLCGSSLGARVAPRRGMAEPLQALLEPVLAAGTRMLIVRVTEAAGARAFDAGELEAATRAVSTFVQHRGASGTAMDLPLAQFANDGKVFTSTGEPVPLLLLLGLPGECFEVACAKFARLLPPAGGRLVAALTSPLPVAAAARAEAALAATLAGMPGASGVPQVETLLFASRHDGVAAPLPNSVVGLAWATPLAAREPGGGVTSEATP